MGESSSIRHTNVARAAKSLVFVVALGLVFGLLNTSVLSDFGITSSRVPYGRSRATSIATTYKTNNHHNTTTTTTTPAPTTRLPSFATNGGVIVFLHVPKTGGTTIRKSFQQRDHVTYLFSNRKSKYDTVVDRVDEWVQTGPTSTSTAVGSSNQSQIGILEIHARNNPTLLSICDQLQQWKATAKEHKVPFFAFTILREPAAFGISYFNYYHGIQWEKRRFEFLPFSNMTEANFIRTMHKNPQCLFLTRSEQAYQRNFPELRQNVTHHECDQAYQCLRRTMDWIGTTERLKNETLPLLHHLIDGDYYYHPPTPPPPAHPNSSRSRTPTTPQHENTGPKIFGFQNMTEESSSYLKVMTEWDQEMYRSVLQDYDFRSFALSS